jgi:hypothetical protein
MRLGSVALACLVTSAAHAQPGVTPPVGPMPPPTAEPRERDAIASVRDPDPVLAEQVAGALVARAQELYDARVFLDAKQLAVEALVRSPRGPAAEQAKFLIRAIDRQLGIIGPEPGTAGDPVASQPASEDGSVIDRSREPAIAEPRASQWSAGAHGALYGGLLGTTLGAVLDPDQPARTAVPAGIAAGLVAGYAVPRLADRVTWNEGQLRTVGSSTLWGGAVGGLFVDLGKSQGTSARSVLVGASLTSTVVGAGGVLLARQNRYSAGDIALVDTLAGIGAVGGLTLGMLMQPAETEAYTLNSALGIVGGVITGLVAAPETNTTPRRMARVAGAAAVGGAIPFLLYAGIYDRSTRDDERAIGALSSLGLVTGAFVGFRLTRGMDEGQDLVPGRPRVIEPDDAPPALLGRSSRGRWRSGVLAIRPLSRELAPQPGMALSLVGATW